MGIRKQNTIPGHKRQSDNGDRKKRKSRDRASERAGERAQTFKKP
jgi:hypothetical protein